MIQKDIDFWKFDKYPDINKEPITNDEGVLLQDDVVDDKATIEYTCVKVKVNGNPIIVDI